MSENDTVTLKFLSLVIKSKKKVKSTKFIVRCRSMVE